MMSEPSLWQLFVNYIKIGLQGWGGPVAQIQVIHEDAVEKKKWIDNDRFKDAYAVCGMLPGPEAAELCMYVGYHKRGVLGGIMAGLGFMLPNFIMITLLAWLYFQYAATSNIAQMLLFGVKPAMVAIVAFSLYRLSNKFGVLTNRQLLFITILMIILSFFTTIDLILLLLAMGFIYMLVKKLTEKNNEKKDKSTLHSIGVEPVLLASSVGFVSSLSANVSWLFLKIGALSFGGAYTVLALLQFEAVDYYGWLTTQQYIDGLAINELTPGPLIMVAAFVGFAAHGFWGATLATFFIFLPAFLFVLLGAPFFESLRKNEKIKLYLAGVSAAVVGLTANFLIRLSIEVFQDWASPIIAFVSLFLLIKMKLPLWSVFLFGLIFGSSFMFLVT
jgi:chromate transporter